jgi:hypothetical protein
MSINELGNAFLVKKQKFTHTHTHPHSFLLLRTHPHCHCRSTAILTRKDTHPHPHKPHHMLGKRPFLFTSPLQSTAPCVEAFWTHWVAPIRHSPHHHPRQGVTTHLSVWSYLSTLLNISHINTTSLHPQANGLVEHFHHRLKSTHRAHCTSLAWAAHLPLFFLPFRSSPHDLTNLCQAGKVFGTYVKHIMISVKIHTTFFTKCQFFPIVCRWILLCLYKKAHE